MCCGAVARESDAGAAVVDQKGGGKKTKLRVAHSLDALADMDVIYLLRLQKERHESGNFIPSLREYVSRYQVGLRHIRQGQKVLHPGPINRGIEISADLADSPENLILQQVEAGLALRMAVLYRIIVDNTAAPKEAEVKNIQAVG
jgi:aspartate carbamoyltransferase catalytic subunit